MIDISAFLAVILSIAGFLAVYLLPGYGVVFFLKTRRGFAGPVPSLVISLTSSLVILTIVSYLYFIRLIHFEQVLIIFYVLAALGALLFFVARFQRKGKPGFQFFPGFNKSLAVICLAIFLFSTVILYLKADNIGGDYFFHLTGVRKIASSSQFIPSQMWGRYNYPPFPAYRYPILHFSIAVAARVAHLDPLLISCYLPFWFFVAAIFVWYSLALVLTGNKNLSLGVAACFCVYTGFLQQFRTVIRFLVPQYFSDLIFFPLLLLLFFLFFREGKRSPIWLCVILPVLATAQLAIHGSHWFYFCLIAVIYSILFKLLRNDAVRWKLPALTLGLLLLLAVPVGMGISENMKTGTLRESYQIEKKHFRRYRFNMPKGGGGRVERLGSSDALIINRFLVFYPYNILCFIYLLYLLSRRRFSKLDIYLITTAMGVILIQFNPLAIFLLAPIFSFPGLFRMIVIIPVPFFLAEIARTLGDQYFKHTILNQLFSRWKKLLLLPLLAGFFVVYRDWIAPAYENYFYRVQEYLFPALPLIMLGMFILAIIRRVRSRPGDAPLSVVPSFSAGHLGLLLVLFSPLFLLQATNLQLWRYQRYQPYLSQLKNTAWVNFVRAQIKPKSVFMSNKKLSKFIPFFTDNYSYVGWSPSSPGVERFARDRRHFTKNVLRDLRGFTSVRTDQELQALLFGKGIDFLLLSRSATNQNVFARFRKSSCLKMIWHNGSIYIFKVLPPSGRKAVPEKGLKDFNRAYSLSDNSAQIWQATGNGIFESFEQVWIKPNNRAERIIISPEKLDWIGIKVYPTAVPSEIKVTVAREAKTIRFDNRAPYQYRFYPGTQPRIIRGICGTYDYSYPIRCETAGADAFLVEFSLPARWMTGPDEDRGGEEPLALNRKQENGAEEVSSRRFRSFFQNDPERYRRKFTRIIESEWSNHLTGRQVVDPDASAQLAWQFDPSRDRPGCLAFGPYINLSPQPWIAVFRLKIKGNEPEGEVASLDVCSGGGKTILAEKKLSTEDFVSAGRYEEFTLKFRNDQPSCNGLEFRVGALGKNTLWLDRVTVYPDLQSWFRDNYPISPVKE